MPAFHCPQEPPEMQLIIKKANQQNLISAHSFPSHPDAIGFFHPIPSHPAGLSA